MTITRRMRCGFWTVLAVVNGVTFATCLHVGLFNWWALGWFLISFAMATHYA